MTRDEFVDNVTSWSELIEFCNNYECDICEGIYDEYDRDAYIDDSLGDMASDADSWQDLLSKLTNITTGYDYYLNDGYHHEWIGLDDSDFDEYFHDILDWADDNGVWDDEEPDEEEPLPEDDEEDDDLVADEPISIGELMGVCSSQLQQIGTDKQAKEAADDETFEVFVASCVTIVEGE